MNRRSLLTLIGSGCIGATAGCSDLTQDKEIKEQEPTLPPGVADTHHGNNAPVGYMTVRNVQDVTDSTLSVDIDVFYKYRDFTINVYQNTPTPDDPGELFIEEMFSTVPRWDEKNQEWSPYVGNGGRFPGVDRRPVRRYNTQDKKVASYDIKNREENGAPEGKSELDRYQADSLSSLYRYDIDIPQPPTGVPITYTFERVATTLEGNPRTIETQTNEILRLPSGEYVTAPLVSNPGHGPGETEAYENAFENRTKYKSSENSHSVSMTLVTSLTRYSMSSEQLRRYERSFEARPLPQFAGNGSFQAVLSRPWHYEVTIPKSVLATEEEKNNERYTWTEETGLAEGPNIKRIADDSEFVDHPLIQEVAQDLNSAANQLGFTSKVEKTRVVADFVQNLRYVLGKQNRLGTVHTPVQTIAHGGDCEDLSLLLYSLLSQDQFDASPVIGRMDGIKKTFIPEEAFEEGNEDLAYAGHIAVGVDFDKDGPGAFFDEDNFRQFEGYTYIECNRPAPLGWQPTDYPEPYVIVE